MCSCGGSCSNCRRRRSVVDAVMEATQPYGKTELERAEQHLEFAQEQLGKAQMSVDRAQAKVDEIKNRPEDNFEDGTVLLIRHPYGDMSIRRKRDGRWLGYGEQITGWEQIAFWIANPNHTVESVETTAEVYLR